MNTIYQFQSLHIIIFNEFLISVWEEYPNYCVSENNVDLPTTPRSEGNDNIAKCQSECTSNIQCSAIEWYEAELMRCYLMLGNIPATQGSNKSRYADATCYVKQGNFSESRY